MMSGTINLDRRRYLMKAAASLAVDGHLRHDDHGGDGYTEPRESWTSCSCGATVWTWQQFYHETGEDPDQNWADHLCWATVNLYLKSVVDQFDPKEAEVCMIPNLEEFAPW